MTVEFVQWKCGCEGLHLPDYDDDVIINPCSEKGKLRFSLSNKCKGTPREALTIDEVVDLAQDMDVLLDDGHILRQWRL